MDHQNTEKDEMKVFVLDTNLHLNNPKSFLSFGGNYVVIPICTIEELDRFKKLGNGEGSAARDVSRRLDHFVQNHTEKDFEQGFDLPNGGKLFIRTTDKLNILKRFGMDPNNDNKILALALALQGETSRKNHIFFGKKVVVVSEDTNLRLKAMGLGIQAQVFKKERVKMEVNDLSLPRIKIPSESFEILKANQKISFSSINKKYRRSVEEKRIALFKNGGSNIAAFLKEEEGGKKFFYLRNLKKEICGFRMKNEIQEIAITLLEDPDLSILVFLGKTGGGKTFLPLLYGFQKVFVEKKYEGITVYRTNHALGRDIGALPGDMQEKFGPWGRPVLDQMKMIVASQLRSGKQDIFAGLLDNQERINKQKGKKKNDPPVEKELSPDAIIDAMVRKQKLEILPILHLRGATMNKRFVIFDEGQNSSSHEMLTFLTRIGSDTKIVITGDISQIDNNYVDEYSNGLSHAVDKLCGKDFFTFLFFEKSERSKIAEAVDLIW